MKIRREELTPCRHWRRSAAGTRCAAAILDAPTPEQCDACQARELPPGPLWAGIRRQLERDGRPETAAEIRLALRQPLPIDVDPETAARQAKAGGCCDTPKDE